MSAFTNKDIIDYYNQTQIHYKRAWDLNNSLAMHYGYYRKDTRNFRDSLRVMNEELALFGEFESGHKVLDAGCGIGGSSFFLAENIGCQVTGISLAERQVEQASQLAKERNCAQLASFQVADFTNTPFPDESFDRIWALESVVHAIDKNKFLTEAKRILKPNGKIIMGEYLKKDGTLNSNEKEVMQKWLYAWAIEDIASLEEYKSYATALNFSSTQFKDVTSHIRKAAWRMYYGSFYMTFLSGLYRIYNPNVSYYADNHYKGLYYQYPALKDKLWKYYFLSFQK